MENMLQIFENEEFGKIRIAGTPENPLFCLTDVCKALEIGNPSDVKKRLSDGVVSIEVIFDSLGRAQNATFVNEDGLYDVILDSRKPEARRFRKWITSEVLPQIRRTGSYSLKKIDYKNLLKDRQFVSDLVYALQAEQEENARLTTENAVLTQQVAELTPKANYCAVVLNCKDLVSVSKIAKDYGMSATEMNKLLHKLGVQYKQGEIWLLYQKYAKLGWTSTKTITYPGSEGVVHSKVHTYWTQAGRLGLYELLKQNGYLPKIEQR